MAELESYPDKYSAWKDKVVLIGASQDDREDAVIQHVKAKRWERTHIVRIQDKALKAYHVNALPTVYIIDQRGNVVAFQSLSGHPGDRQPPGSWQMTGRTPYQRHHGRSRGRVGDQVGGGPATQTQECTHDADRYDGVRRFLRRGRESERMTRMDYARTEPI